MNEMYPVIYNQRHYAVMANDIIKGKQEMTYNEAKIIRLLVTQVVKEDKDLKTHIMKIKDLASFLKISDSDMYRDIKDICDNLAQRVVRIGTGNPKQPWRVIPWIQLASYDGDCNITLMLSEQIKPYVTSLNEWFTQYQLENILEMKSFYGIRLYELLKSDSWKDEDYQEYTVNFLRACFGCENKLHPFANFKARAIEKAIEEINKKSDIEIKSVKYDKKGGRNVVSIKFEVHYNIDIALERGQLPGQIDFNGNEVSSNENNQANSG